MEILLIIFSVIWMVCVDHRLAKMVKLNTKILEELKCIHMTQKNMKN